MIDSVFKRMRYLIVLSSATIILFVTQISLANQLSGLSETKEKHVPNAFVQIYAFTKDPVYLSPWVSLPENIVYGSGSIISGNRILTSAHVIANHTRIQVRKAHGTKRYEARVLSTSHEADLAILTVDDDHFFSDCTSLDIEDAPESTEKVVIFGFPDGDTLTITEGIFSRLRHRKYEHSSSYFLAGEVFSEIKSGHSGAPVIYNNKLVGVVMQANKAGNMAHMVPSPVIQHFLTDIRDGRYDGFPDMGIVTQQMKNTGGNNIYGMSEDQTGVLVRHVISGSPAENHLMKGDVLLAIDHYHINNDSYVELWPEKRLPFHYFVEMKQLYENIDLDVLRSGSVKHITLSLNKTKKDFLLVPREQYDRMPRYFIFGGIIFSPLTKNIIDEWKDPPSEFVEALESWPTSGRKEVVVALMTLPADVNKEYHHVNGWMMSEVNGKKYRDFNEFFEIVANSYEPYVILEDIKGRQVEINREKARKNHRRLLQTYNIKQDRSPDLQRLHAAHYSESPSFQ